MESDSILPLESFITFGDLLKYLRRRARLTQRELAIAVKYSEAQISRLEQNQRPPDLAAVTALFIPALYVDDEPMIVARLMELASQARGETSLKDVITFSNSVREELSELTIEDVRDNLPTPLTSFIGREREIASIKEFLDPHQGNARLVTLLGAGGAGKTRLALQTARETIEKFHNGVWLIELASIANPAHVPQAFITTLGMPEPRDGSYLNTIKKFLRAKHTLLIVDNCEHVLTETANTIHQILLACPHVQVIATSREILDIPGEVRFAVPSLLDSEALSLFTDRARTALPTFELTEENASRVAQICSRLDGIPLAIELAASRLSALSVDQIASLLDDRFNLLTTGSRFTLPRQQTLRAAIDWSYDLLSDEDKKIFHSLSVFAGGFDLASSTSVIKTTPNILDAITRFVDKSLVVVDRLPNGETRYRLLETVREYCREKLNESGEESIIREKHLQYFLSFAEDGDIKLRGKDQLETIKRLEREHDNLRAALSYTMERESPKLAETGLRLALALNYFWFTRGYRQERRDWIIGLKSLPHQPHHTPYYPRALSMSAGWVHDSNEAHRMMEESLSLSAALEDQSAVAAIHLNVAMYNWVEDDPSVGRAHFEKCIALYREIGERWRLARALVELGEYAQVRQDDRNTARQSFEECLQISRELEDTRGIALALIRLGDLLIEQNQLVEAKACFSEGLVLAGELNDRESMAWGINDLGIIAMCEGKLEEAESLCAESLSMSLEWGEPWLNVIRRYWLARVIVYRGDDERAITLFEKNVTESQESNFDWGRGASLQGLGNCALRRGDLNEAKRLHTEAAKILHTGHYGYSLAYSLDSFAALAFAQNNSERALILLSAADAYRESIHTDLLPPERNEREQLLDSIKNTLSPEKISSLIKQGRGMSHDEAVEFALNHA